MDFKWEDEKGDEIVAESTYEWEVHLGSEMCDDRNTIQFEIVQLHDDTEFFIGVCEEGSAKNLKGWYRGNDLDPLSVGWGMFSSGFKKVNESVEKLEYSDVRIKEGDVIRMKFFKKLGILSFNVNEVDLGVSIFTGIGDQLRRMCTIAAINGEYKSVIRANFVGEKKLSGDESERIRYVLEEFPDLELSLGSSKTLTICKSQFMTKSPKLSPLLINQDGDKILKINLESTSSSFNYVDEEIVLSIIVFPDRDVCVSNAELKEYYFFFKELEMFVEVYTIIRKLKNESFSDMFILFKTLCMENEHEKVRNYYFGVEEERKEEEGEEEELEEKAPKFLHSFTEKMHVLIKNVYEKQQYNNQWLEENIFEKDNEDDDEKSKILSSEIEKFYHRILRKGKPVSGWIRKRKKLIDVNEVFVTHKDFESLRLHRVPFELGDDHRYKNSRFFENSLLDVREIVSKRQDFRHLYSRKDSDQQEDISKPTPNKKIKPNLVLKTRGGGYFEVHREIVCLKLNFFHRMVSFGGVEYESMKSKGVIVLEDIGTLEIQYLLEFVYSGEVISASKYSHSNYMNLGKLILLFLHCEKYVESEELLDRILGTIYSWVSSGEKYNSEEKLEKVILEIGHNLEENERVRKSVFNVFSEKMSRKRILKLYKLSKKKKEEEDTWIF